MKPLDLATVNRAIKGLSVSTRDFFYETAEVPYRFGALDAITLLDAPPEAAFVVSHTLHTIMPPLVEFTTGTPPVGVVIARVNEALRREGWIE